MYGWLAGWLAGYRKRYQVYCRKYLFVSLFSVYKLRTSHLLERRRCTAHMPDLTFHPQFQIRVFEVHKIFDRLILWILNYEMSDQAVDMLTNALTEYIIICMTVYKSLNVRGKQTC